MWPSTQALLDAAVAITDRETKAFVWGLVSQGVVVEAKAWALNTLAEHFRALLSGINPSPLSWPPDAAKQLAALEALADAENTRLGQSFPYQPVPSARDYLK
jgi:hypothetical protein